MALQAVRKASKITTAFQPLHGPASSTSTSSDSSSGIGTVEKADLSPVTVADYAVQAVVLNHLNQTFSEDGWIAEEDSVAVQQDKEIGQQVLAAVQSVLPDMTMDLLSKSIDLGKSYTQWNNHRPSRVWCLDPIDGTKGFLRGKLNFGQYCIALALVENGIPTIGILGCPNLLPTEDGMSEQERGCIFVASRGGGCYQLPLHYSSNDGILAKKLSVTPNDASTRAIEKGRFCIGVEKFSDAKGQVAAMAQLLHKGEGNNNDNGVLLRRMDSQAKHGVIARGDAEWYVRLPKPGYVEWIWDHAAGNVVITEAGGQMTDTIGQPIDFSLGAKLSPTVKGILMSNGGVFHQALIDAFAQVDDDS